MVILFTIIIPEGKIRKKFAPKTQVVQSKVVYNRKKKHKNKIEA